MEKKREKKRFNGWVDAEVLNKVAEMAEKERRSLSSMIEVILANAVEQEDKDK